MWITTTGCGAYDHPEFSIEVAADIPQPDRVFLISALEEMVAGGSRFRFGQTLDLGGLLFRIAGHVSGLTLEEPDFTRMPINWKSGCSESLRILRLQKDVVESFTTSFDPDHSALRHSLLVGSDLRRSDKVIVMTRTTPIAADTGWLIGRREPAANYDDPQYLRRISVYEAITRYPVIKGFLAFPAGAFVDLSTSEIRVRLRDQNLAVRQGSYLHRMGS